MKTADLAQQRQVRFADRRKGEANRPAAGQLPNAEEKNKREQLQNNTIGDRLDALHRISSSLTVFPKTYTSDGKHQARALTDVFFSKDIRKLG